MCVDVGVGVDVDVGVCIYFDIGALGQRNGDRDREGEKRAEIEETVCFSNVFRKMCKAEWVTRVIERTG